MIEQSTLDSLARGWAEIPSSPTDFDAMHRMFRDRLVSLAKDRVSNGMNFTHGVAAKLINCYLKPIFLCGVPPLEADAQLLYLAKQKQIHPPIDRLLLTELYVKNFGGQGLLWRQYRDIGWSTFSSEQYESVIALARNLLGDRPLWHLEEYWGGHQ